MRTIKYRGKTIDNFEWIYGLPIKTHIGDYIITEENPHICSLYGYMEVDEFRQVDPNTIGQFTGLYDNNRNEIYDGDIISIVRGHITFTAIVKWNEKEASFGLIINGSDEINKTPLGSWLLFGQCEIIGNIYDNEQ